MALAAGALGFEGLWIPSSSCKPYSKIYHGAGCELRRILENGTGMEELAVTPPDKTPLN